MKVKEVSHLAIIALLLSDVTTKNIGICGQNYLKVPK